MTRTCPGYTSTGGPRRAEELHNTAHRDEHHVSVRVPVHAVDESGRERQVVKDHVIRPRERLAEKVAVDLMAGDVPSGEYLLLGLTDINQLHYRHGYTPIRVGPWILNIDVPVVI
jgi:hypothetical protein